MLTALFLTLLYLTTSTTTTSLITNVYNSTLNTFLMMIWIGTLTFHTKSLFIRPHPIVWRVLLSISISYVSFMAFVSMQSTIQAISTISIFSRPRWSINPFIQAVSSFTKAFIFRKASLSITLMISARPTFHEILSAIIGIKAVEYFQNRSKVWQSYSNTLGIRSKIRRFILQFTPMELSVYNWKQDSKLMAILFLVLLSQWTHRHLMNLLLVDESSILYGLKGLITDLMAVSAMREYKEYGGGIHMNILVITVFGECALSWLFQ